jgi:low temperature requirement protein LtrA
MKKVLEYVGDSSDHELTDPLTGVGLYALFFGVVVYLLGHVGFEWRTGHRVVVSRMVPAVVLAMLVPVAEQVPALAALGIVAAVMVATVTFETLRYAEHRRELRGSAHAG